MRHHHTRFALQDQHRSLVATLLGLPPLRNLKPRAPPAPAALHELRAGRRSAGTAPL